MKEKAFKRIRAGLLASIAFLATLGAMSTKKNQTDDSSLQKSKPVSQEVHTSSLKKTILQRQQKAHQRIKEQSPYHKYGGVFRNPKAAITQESIGNTDVLVASIQRKDGTYATSFWIANQGRLDITTKQFGSRQLIETSTFTSENGKPVAWKNLSFEQKPANIQISPTHGVTIVDTQENASYATTFGNNTDVQTREEFLTQNQPDGSQISSYTKQNSSGAELIHIEKNTDIDGHTSITQFINNQQITSEFTATFTDQNTNLLNNQWLQDFRNHSVNN